MESRVDQSRKDLAELATQAALGPDVIAQRTTLIGETLLSRSRSLRKHDFSAIHADDLATLFDAYDSTFLRGGCRRALGELRLDFRISTRMTRAGGKTFRYTPRNGPQWYEIAVSAPLLFQTFRDVDRHVTVCGRRCDNRLEALQRIFEHELIHLVELLAWNNSECSARRFQSITTRLFSHQAHTHNLITQSERAAAQFGLRPGSHVRFRFEGSVFVGVLNRVTKRATVLVESPRGERYSNGRRYLKFYVPLEELTALHEAG
jgi:hypothetical protein